MTGLVDRKSGTPEVSTGSRSILPLVLGAAVLVLLGFFVGWAGRGLVEEPAPDIGVVLAGEGELTERQEQMIVFLREYITAWQAQDGEGVSEMFVENGRFAPFGAIYRSSDGTIATYVESRGWDTKAIFEPFLVKGNEAVGFHTVGGSTYMNTMQFTSESELLLVNHEIHD